MDTKILKTFETHTDDIRNHVMEEIRKRAETWHYQVLPEEVVSERISHAVREILTGLGDWLRKSGPKDRIFSWFTDLGRKRCGQSMPLEDLSSVILLIRKEMRRIVRQVTAADQLFENEQLGRINHYLDLLFVRIIQSTTLGYRREAAAIEVQRNSIDRLFRRTATPGTQRRA